jgi:hypothetical protein
MAGRSKAETRECDQTKRLPGPSLPRTSPQPEDVDSLPGRVRRTSRRLADYSGEDEYSIVAEGEIGFRSADCEAVLRGWWLRHRK